MLSTTHWPYIYIQLFIILLLLIEVNTKKEENIVFIALVASFVLVFFNVFKGFGVGADDVNYYAYIVGSNTDVEKSEFIFRLVLSLFQRLDLGYSSFLFLVSSTFCASVFRLTRYFKVPFCFWILVYISFGHFFELNFDHLRNALSLSVVIWSIPTLFNRHLTQYVGLILTATFIHFSSIIFLFLPLLFYIKLTNRRVALVLISAVFLTKVDLLAPFFTLLADITGTSIWTLFIERINSKAIGTEYAVGFYWSVFGALKFLIVLLSYYLTKKHNLGETLIFLIKIYLFGILLWAGFHEVNIFSGRFWRSISIVEPILIFYIIKQFSQRGAILLLTIFILMILANHFIPVRSLPYTL